MAWVESAEVKGARRFLEQWAGHPWWSIISTPQSVGWVSLVVPQLHVTDEKTAAEKTWEQILGWSLWVGEEASPPVARALGSLRCSPPPLSHGPTQNWHLPSEASLKEKLPSVLNPAVLLWSIIISLFERTHYRNLNTHTLLCFSSQKRRESLVENGIWF